MTESHIEEAVATHPQHPQAVDLEQQAEAQPRTVDAVTAVTFVWTVEGTVVMVPVKDLALIRTPSDTDLRMLALYLHDQIVSSARMMTPGPVSSGVDDKTLRKRLLEALATDG